MSHEKPTLLVTGLGGMIGAELAKHAERDYRVVSLSRAEGTDITEIDAVRARLFEYSEAEALIHLAAFTDVSVAFTQDGNKDGPCYRANVDGAGNIAQVCAENEVHLIHLSTDFIFDGRSGEPYVEDSEPKPIEWYGLTKWLGGLAARNARSWTIVRISFPYVAGDSRKVDLVRRIHGRLAAGKECKLFDDQIITPTFAGDIAKGLLLLARVRPSGEVFHLCGSDWVSPFELGQKIARHCGFSQELVKPSSMEKYLKVDPRPRQKALRMSNEKWTRFAEKHGLAAPLTLDEGLNQVWPREEK